MITTSHSRRLLQSTSPFDDKNLLAILEIDASSGRSPVPAENPSTGCFVSSANCLRSRRVFDGLGVGDADILQVESKSVFKMSAGRNEVLSPPVNRSFGVSISDNSSAYQTVILFYIKGLGNVGPTLFIIQFAK